MSEALDSFGKYHAAGINIGLGTDTWPPDLQHNMQIGLYVARVMEGDANQTSTADIYNAATLGGAKALGRDDIGRLAPGALARWRTSSSSTCNATTWARSSTHSRT